MPKLTLEIEIEQAAAMTRMIDLAMRIHMRKFGEIDDLERSGELKHRDGRELTFEETDKLRYLLKQVSHVFGWDSCSNFGIGSPYISIDCRRGYEVLKVMNRALAMHRDPNPSLRGVDYDGLIVRYTSDPAPVAVVKCERIPTRDLDLKPVAVFEGYIDNQPVIKWIADSVPAGTELFAVVK